MSRFILRRLLQMVPTVFGVILVTFVLFNLVGGSPGRMALGEKASVRQVDDFDEQRGFNKPLIFGRSIRTLALPDPDLTGGAGPWNGLEGVTHHPPASGDPAFISMPSPVAPALACPLRKDIRYRWDITYREPGGEWQRVEHLWTEGMDEGSWNEFMPSGRVDVARVQLRRLVDRPFDSQFMAYLGQLVRLDFGMSTSANLPVAQLLKDGWKPTMMLALPILVVEVIVSLAVGLLCAYYRGRWIDRSMVFIAVALMSVNYLVWIVAGQYVLAFRAGLFPVWGFESWVYLCLPALVGVLSGLGGNVRFYRTVLLDEVHKDYVRTAYAKGLTPFRVLTRHVLPNALVPIITNIMLAIPFLYTGSLLLESYFGIPGIGYLSVRALNASDPDVIRAVVLLGSLLYVVIGLIGDLLCAWLDPRIKLT